MSNTTTGGESIRQVTGHQSRLILAIACVASVMYVTSAQAQGTEVTRTRVHNQDSTFSVTNPCNGGTEVSGQGHSNIQSTERSSPSGTDATIKIFENGQGMSTDGARYQYSLSDSSRLRSSTPNFTATLHLRLHVVREGPRSTKDSYFQYIKVTTSVNNPPTRAIVRVDCK